MHLVATLHQSPEEKSSQETLCLVVSHKSDSCAIPWTAASQVFCPLGFSR